ncbi:MAG: DUF4358 domain-containing protein [Sarcina sp.]
MKKFLVCSLAAILVGGTFIACGEEKKKDPAIEQQVNININETLSSFLDAFEIRMPGDATDQDLKEVYKINIDNIEEYAMKQCMMTPGVDVIGIFKAKSGKAEEVKTDVQKIIETKRTSAYLPGEMDALENSQVIVNGDYVGIFLIEGQEDENGEIENQAQKAADKFKALFN